MRDMMNMLKQAKEMQKKLEEAQSKLGDTVVTGSAGGQAVEIALSGTYDVKSIKIKPEAVDPEDVETLEDLVQAALKDALQRVKDTTQSQMGAITGGLSLPGM